MRVFLYHLDMTSTQIYQGHYSLFHSLFQPYILLDFQKITTS